MRFEFRYFFLEIGLSPKGLTQSQEKSILFQTSLHTSTSQWNDGAHILNHLPNVGALAT